MSQHSTEKFTEKLMKNLEDENEFLMEHEGSLILRDYGLPVAVGQLAKNGEEGVEIANKIGYPVVLKGMSRDIVHKTEAGVVKLNIRNEEDVLRNYESIMEYSKKKDSNARISGVYVQKMVPKGLELILGVKKDPIFGHQLIIGMGGTFVEVMKDFTMKMMPVSASEVKDMTRSLKSYPLLSGYRGGEKINFEKLAHMVFKLNELIKEKPEIMELDLNPVMFYNDQAEICDVRLRLGIHQDVVKTKKNSLEHMNKMLNPKSIAVVGASTDQKKNGGRLFRFIVENGFTGDLYPINPKATEVRGYKCYPSLKDVSGGVDLACIIVASAFVPQVMRDCVAKGVRNVIIYSSGFAEVGEEGERLQKEVVDIARKGNIRVLGPNSIGIASPSKKIFTAFGNALESKTKPLGHIGFVSQSGAMGSALLSRAWEQGAGFSRWVSVGNEADLSISDFINVLADDEETKVISVFMESISDKESFRVATKRALDHKKPVLVYKTGRSDVGKRAVQSHTGSIAGDDAVYSAAFKKYGVLRIEKIEELIDVSRAFSIQPIPKGKRIGIITASGGACSVVADLCSERGMEVPDLASADAIYDIIPPFGSTRNPIDVTAEIIAKPEMFKKVLQTVVDDENVDGVIVMMTTNADPGASVIARAIMDVFNAQRKPIVLGRLGAEMIAPNATKLYKEEGFPVYPTPEQAVNVMHYLCQYNDVLQKINEVER
jgi:acetyl coenzyme A synthetase (ADP forming)-like protein